MKYWMICSIDCESLFDMCFEYLVNSYSGSAYKTSHYFLVIGVMQVMPGI